MPPPDSPGPRVVIDSGGVPDFRFDQPEPVYIEIPLAPGESLYAGDELIGTQPGAPPAAPPPADAPRAEPPFDQLAPPPADDLPKYDIPRPPPGGWITIPPGSPFPGADRGRTPRPADEFWIEDVLRGQGVSEPIDVFANWQRRPAGTRGWGGAAGAAKRRIDEAAEAIRRGEVDFEKLMRRQVRERTPFEELLRLPRRRIEDALEELLKRPVTPRLPAPLPPLPMPEPVRIPEPAPRGLQVPRPQPVPSLPPPPPPDVPKEITPWPVPDAMPLPDANSARTAPRPSSTPAPSPRVPQPRALATPAWWPVLAGLATWLLRRNSTRTPWAELWPAATPSPSPSPPSPQPSPAPVPSPMPGPGLTPLNTQSARSPPRNRRCHCSPKKRKPPRECTTRGQLIWASGPKKGKPAGSRCVNFKGGK